MTSYTDTGKGQLASVVTLRSVVTSLRKKYNQ